MTLQRIKPFACLLLVAAAVILAAITIPFIPRSPTQYFEAVTRLKLPRSAEILIDLREALGPFGRDGFRGIEVKVDEETIRKWLKLRPLACTAKWTKGPLSRNRLVVGWEMPPADVYDLDTTYYAICCDDTGDGELIIVDPIKERAWLVSWW